MAGLVGWWLGVAASACDGGEGLSTLVAALDEGDRLLAELDSAGFAKAVDRARALVPCLPDPITPPIAARLHRAVGVRMFGERDPLASAAFAAARRVQPAHGFPETLFPPESPVDVAWSAFPLVALRNEVLPAPVDGWIALDGSRSTVRPAELPVVYQALTWDGQVVAATYLLPGEAPPAPVAPPSQPVRIVDERRLTWAVTAGAAGVTAATFWGLSVHGRARYGDLADPVPDTKLDGLRARTNALAVGSVLGAGLCAASGALLVATW